MSNLEKPSLTETELAALETFWAGDRSKPFHLARQESHCVCDVLFPGPWASLLFGLRCLAGGIINAIPFSSIKISLLRLMGVKIGKDVFIAPEVFIDPFYPWLIELEDDAFLGLGCRIFTHEYTADDFRIGRVRVGRGSVIGTYATVRCGVNIGAKVTVGACSFVNKDVPDGVTVAGVPAREIVRGSNQEAK